MSGIFGLKNVTNNVAIFNLPAEYRPASTFNHIDTGTGVTVYRTQFVSTGAVMFQWAYKMSSTESLVGDIGWLNLEICYPANTE